MTWSQLNVGLGFAIVLFVVGVVFVFVLPTPKWILQLRERLEYLFSEEGSNKFFKAGETVLMTVTFVAAVAFFMSGFMFKNPLDTSFRMVLGAVLAIMSGAWLWKHRKKRHLRVVQRAKPIPHW